MDEFEWIPDWSAQSNATANVSRVQFGDGYIQRQTKGMNPVAKSWNLTFNSRTDAEAEDIIDFLEERYGVVAFTWTPPGEAQAKFICNSWPRTIPGYGVNNISCVFELVHEP